MSTSNKKLAEHAKLLARLRTERNLNQEEAATLLGVSRNYISMIENGRPPSDKFVSKIKYELLKSEQSLPSVENPKALLDFVLGNAPIGELVLRLEQINADTKLTDAQKWDFASYVIPKLRERLDAEEREKS